MRIAATLAVLTSLSLASLVQASEGLPVEPGLWKMRSESKMPMMPAPRINETQECVTDSEISPGLFMRDSKECSFSDVVREGNTIRWKIRCDMQGGTVTGSAEFSSTGSTVQGSMTMKMPPMNGQEMEFQHVWQGSRVGDCE